MVDHSEKGLIRRFMIILSFIVSAFIMSTISAQVAGNVGGTGVRIEGEQRLWHRVTLTFDGPMADEEDAINPFTDYRLDVTFTNGDLSYKVPGFFAADGDAQNTGATSGNKWRVHFTPDKVGSWSYTVDFITGDNVALYPENGINTHFDGISGTFIVEDTDKSGQDFRAHGILRYVGEHYLKFAGSGEYYLKSGADSPENFLAYDEFDGTYDTGGIIDDFLHQYDVHAADWNSGDPEWANNQGRNIIGAINYLAAQRVNSVYLITYNIDSGDGMDTWPWTSHTERYRFDVSKLDQWETVFSHMTNNGVQIHLVTQENENDQKLGNSSGLNDVRKLYYRELVARFSHHPALQWNIGEENDNTTVEKNAFSQYIRDLDPYNHPIAVHTYYNLKENFGSGSSDTYYDDLIGSPAYEATSLQGDATNYNRWAVMLRQQSSDAGRPWVIYGDEQGPRVASNMSNINEIVRDAMWGNLLGGGAGVEWYFGYQGCCFGDMQSDDWRVAEPLWKKSARATQFMYDYVPFAEMTPNNNLLQNKSTNIDAVLAKPGDTYVVLLRQGTQTNNPSINLQNDNTTYTVGWFDPRGETQLMQGSVSEVSGGSIVSLGDAPYSQGQEWIVLLTTDDSIVIESSTNPPPTPPANSISVDRLILVNADTNKDIMELNNNTSIVLSDLPTQNLNIRAETNKSSVGSVRFGLNDNTSYQTENVAPYALAGDSNGNYVAWNPSLKQYVISAIPYSEANGNGTVGTGLTITIEFIVAGTNPSPQIVNPGNQVNNAGSSVNLPIFVTDDNNVSCTATGLPSGLSMGSNCQIAGVTADSCEVLPSTDGMLMEQNGLLVADLDDVEPSDFWSVESAISGAIDNTYYEWKSGNNSGGIDKAGTLGVLEYPIQITTLGIYRFQIRSAAPHNTEHNDVWARFEDAKAVFGIKSGFPTSSASNQSGYYGIGNGWFKVYQNKSNNSWTWTSNHKDNDAHSIYVEFTNPGTYTMALSGRSTKFKVDRMVLWQQPVTQSSATSLSLQPTYTSNTNNGEDCNYSVQVIATDDGQPSQSSQISFNWMVNPPIENVSPSVSPVASQTSIIDQPVTLQINATDSDSTNLVYQSINLPTGLEINSTTGQITGNPTVADTYNVTITVFDEINQSAGTSFNWTVVEGSQNPPPPETGVSVTRLIMVNADTNTDLFEIADNQIIDFNILPTTNLNIRAETNPSTVSSVVFDLNNVEFNTENIAPYAMAQDIDGNYEQWQPTLGSYTVVAKPYDSKSGAGQEGQVLSRTFQFVDNTPINIAPQVTTPSTQNTVVGTAVSLQIQASDPENSPLTYTAINLPLGTQIDYQTGLISGTPTTISQQFVQVVVFDADGLDSDIATFEWNIIADPNPPPVVNLQPQVSAVVDQSTMQGTTVSLQIQASDPENSSLSYTATGLPNGLQIDFASGLISGIPTSIGQSTVEIIVFDTEGLPSTPVTFSWTVTQAPQTNPPPANNDPAIVAFTLINADTNQDIQALTDNMTIYLGSLPTENLNIRAEVNDTVTRVRFTLNDTNNSTTSTENVAPYAMKGDIEGNYNNWNPLNGTYTLTALPSAEVKGQTIIGQALTINFTVEQTSGTVVIVNPEEPDTDVVIVEEEPDTGVVIVEEEPDTGVVIVEDNNTPETNPETPSDNNPPPANVLKVTRFVLVNADTNQDIMQLDNGATISLGSLPTQNLNIRAEVEGSVKSVRFTGSESRLESVAPFAMAGDLDSNYFTWNPSTDNYSITATPYAETKGKGDSGDSLTISISFTN